jgi:hypothetical protein
MNSKEYKTAILQKLKEILHSNGFKKKGSIFVLSTDDLTYYIGLQSSQSSTASVSKVTVNTEIASAVISKLDDTSLPINHQRHYIKRIGFYLEPPFDKWWVLDSMESTEIAINEIIEIIQKRVLTCFSSLKTTDDLVNLWQSGTCPGLTDRQRKHYLQLIA